MIVRTLAIACCWAKNASLHQCHATRT